MTRRALMGGLAGMIATNANPPVQMVDVGSVTVRDVEGNVFTAFRDSGHVTFTADLRSSAPFEVNHFRAVMYNACLVMADRIRRLGT